MVTIGVLIGPGGTLGEILGGIWLVVLFLLVMFVFPRAPRTERGWKLQPLDLTPTQRRRRQANRMLIGTIVTVVVVVVWVAVEYFRYARR